MISTGNGKPSLGIAAVDHLGHNTSYTLCGSMKITYEGECHVIRHYEWSRITAIGVVPVAVEIA